MNKNSIITGIIIVLLISAVGYIMWQNKLAKTASLVAPAESTLPARPPKKIEVTTPLNTPLSGDAIVAGIARLVFFEGSFPVKLMDSNNTTVWQGPAIAQGEWMTTEDVPFVLVIPTQTLPNGAYTLVMTQDDATGELVPPELYSISIPVTIAN